MKQRVLSLILAAIMVFSLLPISAVASGTTYTITNGSPAADKEQNGGYIVVDASAAEGDEVEVTVVPNGGYQLKALSYTAAPKTIADILPEDFPIAESDVSGAPSTAWKSAMLDQLCYVSHDESELVFYKEAGTPNKSFSIHTNAVLSADEDGNYVYTNGTVTATFSMAGEGGALNFILFANTADETWNGTYQASACVAAGTMVTLYNGEQKAIENLEIGDVIRTFDHETGEISSAPVCFIWASKNAANAFTLTFEDGVKVTVIEEHGFYDYEKNKYVFLNAANAKDYIGHRFYHADTESWKALEDIELLPNCVDAYAIATSKHLNHPANGMLSICDGTFEKIANLFEYDEEMKYDAELKDKEIESYGLTSLDHVLTYKGFNAADYEDYNLQYLDVALGKGLVSPEWIEALSEYCAANNIYDSFPVSETPKVEAPKMLLMSASAPQKMLGSAPELTTESDIEIPSDIQGKYIFTMPAQNILVTAVFEEVPHVHSLVKVDGQAPTETTGGFKGYYECKDSDGACGALFEDENGTTPIENLTAWKAEDGGGYLAPLGKPEYGILIGANSKWVKGSESGVILTSSGPYDKFAAAYLDGKLISENSFSVYPAAMVADLGEVGPSQLPWQWTETQTDGGQVKHLNMLFNNYSLVAIPLGGKVVLLDENGRVVTDAGALPAPMKILTERSLIQIRGSKPIGSDSPLVWIDGDQSNTDMKVRVRGGGSISASGTPLYIVDGAPSGAGTIRIRGIGANNDNDPLSIVDGAENKFITAYLIAFDPTFKSGARITSDAANGASLIIMINITSRLPDINADALIGSAGVAAIPMSNLLEDPELHRTLLGNQAGTSVLLVAAGVAIDEADGSEGIPTVSALTGMELKPEYLETLSVGNHTLKLVYTDGTEVSTNIEIVNTPTSPDTGDTSDPTLWLVLLVGSSLELFACLFLGKKKKNVQ